MRLLITGSNGLLGQKIVKQCLAKGLDFIATSKGENRNPDCPDNRFLSMDISNILDIKKVFDFYYPTHVIHTAAITNVDYCEDHIDECQTVNVEATKFLVQVSNTYKAHIQFLSTDFVFDGEKGNYIETDPVNPLSVYAQSKVDGEKIVQELAENWSIARTIIVYGEGHNLSRSNIVLWAREALKSGNPLTIVDDQFRAPTWADDLAWGCLAIVLKNKQGIFHLSGPETMSIIDLVYRIADFYQLPKNQVTPSKSSNLNQAAKRPPKTGFDLTKAKIELGYNPMKLEETLSLLF
jgi:dTDP-4-dehydrorhamnose reductase